MPFNFNFCLHLLSEHECNFQSTVTKWSFGKTVREYTRIRNVSDLVSAASSRDFFCMEDYVAGHYTTQSSPFQPVLLQDTQNTSLCCYLFGLGTYKQILRSNDEETKITTNHATRCPHLHVPTISQQFPRHKISKYPGPP
jgi:hypothetical protein